MKWLPTIVPTCLRCTFLGEMVCISWQVVAVIRISNLIAALLHLLFRNMRFLNLMNWLDSYLFWRWVGWAGGKDAFAELVYVLCPNLLALLLFAHAKTHRTETLSNHPMRLLCFRGKNLYIFADKVLRLTGGSKRLQIFSPHLLTILFLNQILASSGRIQRLLAHNLSVHVITDSCGR